MKRYPIFLAAGLMLLSVHSYGQFTISSLPTTINQPGTYVVVGELTYSGSNGNAITVQRSNVTIDLNGHYLFCPTSGNTAFAISADNRENITVRNGQIIGFYVGVYLIYSSGTNVNSGHLVQNVRFTNDVYGVYTLQSQTSLVKDCQITKASGTGIWFSNGSGNKAASNLINQSGTGCASDTGADYFESNYLNGCSVGIYQGKTRFNTTSNCTTPFQGTTTTAYLDE
jgi:parallel beta-helix repeat protein